MHKFVCILITPFLKDSAAEQQQVKYLLECVRKISKGKEKEMDQKEMIFQPGIFDEALENEPKKKVKKTPKYVEVGKFLIGWCINLFVFF